MFVLLTLACVGFCGWVHSSKEWIRQRHEWLAENGYTHIASTRESRAPAGLWMFGEKGITSVACAHKDAKLVQRLFPEAHVDAYIE
jgi:hypothetical protein